MQRHVCLPRRALALHVRSCGGLRPIRVEASDPFVWRPPTRSCGGLRPVRTRLLWYALAYARTRTHDGMRTHFTTARATGMGPRHGDTGMGLRHGDTGMGPRYLLCLVVDEDAHVGVNHERIEAVAGRKRDFTELAEKKRFCAACCRRMPPRCMLPCRRCMMSCRAAWHDAATHAAYYPKSLPSTH